MEKTLNMLDHPLPFLLFMTLAIFGVRAVAKWGANRAGWTGVAAFFQ
jgi:hypothetical protein